MHRTIRPMGPLAQARAALSVAFVLTACAARGAITVTPTPSSGTTWSVTPLASGKFRVALGTSVINQPTTFLVRGAASDRIETITVTSSVPQIIFVEVRGTSVGTPIASLDLIECVGTSTFILQDLRTSGDVGSVRLNTISAMNVAGDVTGDLVMLQRATGGESALVSANVSGRIRGNVIADFGGIYALAAGGVGAPGAPVQVRSKLAIESLVAGEIHADVSTLGNGGAGITGIIQTTSGPFVGSLTSTSIGSPSAGKPGALLIAGNLDANVTLSGSIRNQNGGQPVVSVGGALSAGRTIRVGGSIESGAEVRIASAGGLLGRILVNAQDAGAQWLGTVRVAGSALGPVPAYSATSGVLGGGTVGAVPFALHAADCWPISGAPVAPASGPSPSNPWRVRFYGPVAWTGGAGSPVIIESRPLGSMGPWQDVTACFTAGREPGASPNACVVALYPSRALARGREYRARPVRSGAGALLCDLALATNPPVADGVASFVVTGACAGDANGDGLVSFADITALLANWGTASLPCFSTADVNADGGVSFADVTFVLANWGVPCS